MFAHTLSLGRKRIVLLKMLLNTDLPRAEASVRAAVLLVLFYNTKNKSMVAVACLAVVFWTT